MWAGRNTGSDMLDLKKHDPGIDSGLSLIPAKMNQLAESPLSANSKTRLAHKKIGVSNTRAAAAGTFSCHEKFGSDAVDDLGG